MRNEDDKSMVLFKFFWVCPLSTLIEDMGPEESFSSELWSFPMVRRPCPGTSSLENWWPLWAPRAAARVRSWRLGLSEEHGAGRVP